jgi:hypothetical protein
MAIARPVLLDRQPMVVVDQHGTQLFAWFPAGTPVDTEHVLPVEVYVEVCRLAGVSEAAPWAAFEDRVDAVVAMAAACLALGYRLTPAAG